MIFKRRTKPAELKSLEELEALKEGSKPILVDFYQNNCQPCRTMDGVVNELADEFSETAHVVKVNVGTVPGAVQEFKIQSTPTFVLLGRSQKKLSKKARKAQREAGRQEPAPMSPRWRASGLVRKDVMERVLVSNGAAPRQS